MAVKTQAELQADVASLFANNTSGGISESDLRTFLTDLLDTAIDRWVATSPQTDPNSPVTSGLITSLLADNTAGDISPSDVRSILGNIREITHP